MIEEIDKINRLINSRDLNHLRLFLSHLSCPNKENLHRYALVRACKSRFIEAIYMILGCDFVFDICSIIIHCAGDDANVMNLLMMHRSARCNCNRNVFCQRGRSREWKDDEDLEAHVSKFSRLSV